MTIFEKGQKTMKIKWQSLSEREKNELIAKYVTKGTETRKYRDVSDMTGEWNPVTDLNDAWEIVTKFSSWYSFLKSYRRNFDVSMGNDLSEGKFVTFGLIVNDGIKNFTYSGEAYTLQEAICLASLEAVGIKVEDKYDIVVE